MAKMFGKVSKTAKWQNILVKLAKQQNGNFLVKLAKQQNSKTFWSSYISKTAKWQKTLLKLAKQHDISIK